MTVCRRNQSEADFVNESINKTPPLPRPLFINPASPPLRHPCLRTSARSRPPACVDYHPFSDPRRMEG